MPFVPRAFYGTDYLFAGLCAAFAFEAIVGCLPGFRQILALPASFARWLARRADIRLNRAKRSARSRRMRGMLVAILPLAPAFLIGYHGAQLCRSVADGWVINIVLVAMCVGLQRPVVTAAALRRAIGRAGFERAREILERATAGETAITDEYGIARGSVELFAVRLCDGFVGPVFWYLIAGLPGLFVYRAIVATADALAHPTPSYVAFGAAAAALDRFVNFVPGPVAGVLIVAGSLFSPTARPLAALRGMFRGVAGRSPRQGWTQGAVAGALGLCLAGPRRLRGEVAPGGWIGDGRARANSTDIARATWLYMISVFIGLVPIALLALVVPPR